MPETETATDHVGKIIFDIAREIGADHYSRGDRAALRRLNDEAPNAPAFWSLMATCHPGVLEHGEDEIRRWALIVRGMALMAPHHHDAGSKPGRVLASEGFSELRLAKLLNARGTQFREQFLRACRFLAAKGAAVDWRVLARLALAEGRDETRAEKHRMDIARSYFRTLRAKAAA